VTFHSAPLTANSAFEQLPPTRSTAIHPVTKVFRPQRTKTLRFVQRPTNSRLPISGTPRTRQTKTQHRSTQTCNLPRTTNTTNKPKHLRSSTNQSQPQVISPHRNHPSLFNPLLTRPLPRLHHSQQHQDVTTAPHQAST
jgi:hypothetical protein